MAMEAAEIEKLIKEGLPDAEVRIEGWLPPSMSWTLSVMRAAR